MTEDLIEEREKARFLGLAENRILYLQTTKKNYNPDIIRERYLQIAQNRTEMIKTM